MQPKLIYLAQRRADMTRAQFVARWRRHAALGISRPRWINIARYVHCDVLDAGAALPGICDDYDGVGLIWHRSPEARAAHRADTSSQAEMEADELETFREPVVNCCLLAEQLEGEPCPAPESGTVKLFRFERFTAPLARADVLANVVEPRRDVIANLAEDRGRPLGYCTNLPLTAAVEGRTSWGLSADLVEEFWFEDLEPLAAFRECNPASRGRIKLPHRVIEIVTNEVALYERSTG